MVVCLVWVRLPLDPGVRLVRNAHRTVVDQTADAPADGGVEDHLIAALELVKWLPAR